MSKMCEIEIHSFPLGFDPETGIQSKPAPVGSAIWIKFPYNLGWKQSEERSGLNTAKDLLESKKRVEELEQEITEMLAGEDY